MIIEKQHNGILVSDIVNGFRVKKLYQGYTMKEIKQDFKLYIKEKDSQS